MDRETARAIIEEKYVDGKYFETPMRLNDALMVMNDIFDVAKCIEAKELNDDADIRVLGWELVGQKVFIVRSGKIVERTLGKITIEKDSSGLTVQTAILYRCDADTVLAVYKTREACAEAWLKEQGITTGLKDCHE